MADPIALTFQARDAVEAQEMIQAVEAVRARRGGRRGRSRVTISDVDRARADKIADRIGGPRAHR